MRNKIIIIFSKFIILSIIFVSFIDFCPHHIKLQNNSSNNEIENKGCFNNNLLNNSNLELNQGNATKIVILSISNPGGKITPDPTYVSFIGSNLLISFLLYDLNYSGNIVTDIDNQATFSISYKKTSGSNQLGTLNSDISFDNNTYTFNGIIETSALTEPGNYSIRIFVDLLGYETNSRRFDITLLERFALDIVITRPNQLVAGEKFDFSIKAGYTYKSTFFPIVNQRVYVTVYLNNYSSLWPFSRRIDIDGKAGIIFILPLNSKDISFKIVIYETYYYENVDLVDNNLTIIPYFEFVKQISINITIAISSLIIIIFVFYKLSISKKRKRKKILVEFKQTYEDILKLEHAFILFKSSNEIILNKSYTSEKINNNLLNEFMSFISSFNTPINPLNSINELNYKNKILLITEGKFVIINIILKDKISIIFKNKLKEFLNYIETLYKNEFSSTNIDSNSFKNIEYIFEKKLNLSINSPHSIELGENDAPLKAKSPPMNIYNIMKEIIREKKKNSFYLSEIFSKFTEQTGKGILEFIMGITELKDTNRIIPININS